VHFPYNAQWKNELKTKFPTAKWSVSKKCWYLNRMHETLLLKA